MCYSAPPEEQTIERDMENITIKLAYDSVFSNMLQINVAIMNHNDSPLFLTDVRLRSTCNVSFFEFSRVHLSKGIWTIKILWMSY